MPKFFLRSEEPLWLGVTVLAATFDLHMDLGSSIKYMALETREKAPVSGTFGGAWKVVIGVGKIEVRLLFCNESLEASVQPIIFRTAKVLSLFTRIFRAIEVGK